MLSNANHMLKFAKGGFMSWEKNDKKCAAFIETEIFSF